eukprot:g5593.t1
MSNLSLTFSHMFTCLCVFLGDSVLNWPQVAPKPLFFFVAGSIVEYVLRSFHSVPPASVRSTDQICVRIVEHGVVLNLYFIYHLDSVLACFHCDLTSLQKLDVPLVLILIWSTEADYRPGHGYNINRLRRIELKPVEFYSRGTVLLCSAAASTPGTDFSRVSSCGAIKLNLKYRRHLW